MISLTKHQLIFVRAANLVYTSLVMDIFSTSAHYFILCPLQLIKLSNYQENVYKRMYKYRSRALLLNVDDDNNNACSCMHKLKIRFNDALKI